MHIYEGFVLLTPSAIALDFAVFLLAFLLGLFGYIRQIGAWVFGGILVIVFGGIHLMPDNGAPITLLGITAVTLGSVAGFLCFEPKVHVRHSTRAQGSPFANAHSGPTGFENVESDVNEQTTETPFEEERHDDSQVRTESKDYYGMLGVARTASQSEIKLAYRRQMKNCHPDLFPGDKEREATAKEVNEAFNVLGDEQKRAAFDRYGFVA